MLLRVSCLLRSNHQPTAKISGYNQRYRENRTKNTRPSGSWRVSYAAWCVISDRSLDLMIWSNPAFQLGLPPSRACDHRFPVGAHPTSSPGLFPKKMGTGEPWRQALCPCRWTPICQYAWLPPEPNWRNTGADLGGGCRGCAPPPPSWDDLRFSNTTGILQKKNYVVYWCWRRARDECTPS